MGMKAGEIVFLQERLDKIEELLLIEGKVLVRDLSEQFKVSESMIRKDLQMLEKQGRLNEHTEVLLASVHSFTIRELILECIMI